MQGSLRGNKGPRIRHVVEEGAPFETITVDKVTPVIGAEVGNIDLSKPLSNRQQDEIHRALAENCVLFFRDQHISPDQHLAFGRLFGDLHVHGVEGVKFYTRTKAVTRRWTEDPIAGGGFHMPTM